MRTWKQAITYNQRYTVVLTKDLKEQFTKIALSKCQNPSELVRNFMINYVKENS